VLDVKAAARQHILVGGRFRSPAHRQQEVDQHRDGGPVLTKLKNSKSDEVGTVYDESASHCSLPGTGTSTATALID